MSSRANKAAKGAGVGFLQCGLQIILQALLAPLILKISGRETLGAYAILMQAIGYGILLDLGFGTALSRYLAQAFGIDDKGYRFVETFNIGRRFYLFTNFIFGCLIFVFSHRVNKILLVNEIILSQARLSLYLFGLWVIIRTPLTMYNNTLTATQNLAASNFIAIVGNANRLIFSLVLVFMKTGLVGLMLANILAEILIAYLHLRRFKKLFPDYKFGWGIRDWVLFKDMCSFGLRYWGVNAAVLFFYGTDNIVIGYLYGAALASIYYTTKIPISLTAHLIFKLPENAAPAANELFARKEYIALQNAYLRLLRCSMLLVVPIALAAISLNRLLVSLWVGSRQYGGDLMTVAFAVYAILSAINHVNGHMVVVCGNIRHWSTLSIILGIANLLLSLFLGRVLGIPGVAVALVLTCLPGLVFLWYRSMQSLKIKFAQLWNEVYKPTLISNIPVGILTIIIIMKLSSLTFSWVTLFILIGLYALFWGVGIYKFGINDKERNTIISFVKLRFASSF